MRNPLSPKGARSSGILVLLLLLIAFFQAAPGFGAGESGIQFWIDRFIIEGENPIADSAAETVLKPFTGRSLVFSDLEAAASLLESAFQDAGFPFYRIGVPPQRITNKELRLRVVPYPLKDIQVEENQYFEADNIRYSLPVLKIGQSPNTLEVARALQFANEHPAKRTAVFIKQDPAGDGINARVVARDVRPYQAFASVNNTGGANPGRTRTAVGLQHSNLFNRDHILTATYTTSPDGAGDVSQCGVDYRLPFYPAAIELEGFYSYSQVDQGVIGDFFDVSGRGQFFGFNATHTLLPVGAYSHKVSARYQNRFFDNETTYLGTTLASDVRSAPLGLRYSGSYEPKNLNLGLYVGYEFNTGSGSYNDPENYAANRSGAERQWDKFTAGGGLQWMLPGEFQLRGSFSAQYSDEPLIPGEQFGIGGFGSVRGYEARELSGDYGVQGSLEAWSPPLLFDARLVAFADAGEVYNHSPYQGTDDRQGIFGVGMGLRWNWKGHVDVSCDVSHALENAATTEAGDTRVLYQVLLRY